jgi:hypothetical protein
MRLHEIRGKEGIALLRQVGKIQWLFQDTRFVEHLIYQGKILKSGVLIILFIF